jgi:N-acetylglucosaminyldiphosphoundecaprenol N-acetyl-beta-D-mannosaminyltransferase
MSSLASVQQHISTRSILGVNVCASSYEQMIHKALRWAAQRESRALFFANVHVIMEAFDDPRFRSCLNNSDMVNPDGVPLVWALRALGETEATRVYGPDATVAMLTAAEQSSIPVGFYGASPYLPS